MITARDFRSYVAGATQAEYQQLEDRIDTAIQNAAALGKRDGDQITVTVEGVSVAVRERAVSDYTVAGWRVNLISGYTDGDFLMLRSK